MRVHSIIALSTLAVFVAAQENDCLETCVREAAIGVGCKNASVSSSRENVELMALYLCISY